MIEGGAFGQSPRFSEHEAQEAVRIRPLGVGRDAQTQQSLPFRPTGRRDQHRQRHIDVRVFRIERQSAPRFPIRFRPQLRRLVGWQRGGEIGGVFGQVRMGRREAGRLGGDLPQGGQQLIDGLLVAPPDLVLEEVAGAKIERQGRRIRQSACRPQRPAGAVEDRADPGGDLRLQLRCVGGRTLIAEGPERGVSAGIVQVDADREVPAIALHGSVEQQSDAQLPDLPAIVRAVQGLRIRARHGRNLPRVEDAENLVRQALGELMGGGIGTQGLERQNSDPLFPGMGYRPGEGGQRRQANQSQHQSDKDGVCLRTRSPVLDPAARRLRQAVARGRPARWVRIAGHQRPQGAQQILKWSAALVLAPVVETGGMHGAGVDRQFRRIKAHGRQHAPISAHPGLAAHPARLH